MKASNPKPILDIYEWLPGYGENKIELCSDGRNLIVHIFYDSEISEKENCLSLKFINTCSYNFSSFPSATTNGIEYEPCKDFTNLVEFKVSELADKWLSMMPFYDKIRHYRIIFTSENKQLEIFANTYTKL